MYLGKIFMKLSVNIMVVMVFVLNKRDIINYLLVGFYKIFWWIIVIVYSGKVCIVKVRDNFFRFECLFL